MSKVWENSYELEKKTVCIFTGDKQVLMCVGLLHPAITYQQPTEHSHHVYHTTCLISSFLPRYTHTHDIHMAKYVKGSVVYTRLLTQEE